MPFKKTLIALLLLGLLGAYGWLSLLPGIARGRVESYLRQAGYKPQAIGEVIIRPPYIFAKDIRLDKDGFNTIGLMGVQTEGLDLKIVQVQLDDIQTSATANNLSSILRLIAATQKNLPDSGVQIDKMTSDFATPYGDLRLETTLSMAQPDENGKRAISATIKARQYQLSFDTKWNGTINNDGTALLDAEIMDGRLNIGPARLSRLTGWLSWQSRGEELPQISGQIDAGSGTLFALPLSNINLTMGHADKAIDLMFRTGLSGIENVRLSLDSKITQEDNHFDGALDIPDSDAFFTYIQTLHPKNVPDALRSLGPVRVGLAYREDRRFTGGPLPFALTALSTDTTLATGNILIYPDTLELRGSAQMSEPLAEAVQLYFGIAKDKRTGGALRLDGEVKSLLEGAQDAPEQTTP